MLKAEKSSLCRKEPAMTQKFDFRRRLTACLLAALVAGPALPALAQPVNMADQDRVSVCPVVLSEVQSADPDNSPDWIELANPTRRPLDVSGLVVKDRLGLWPYTIPQGTVIPAEGSLVLSKGPAGFRFDLGASDCVRLYQDIDGVQTLIAKVSWSGGTVPSLAWDSLTGTYRPSLESTPGGSNRFQ